MRRVARFLAPLAACALCACGQANKSPNGTAASGHVQLSTRINTNEAQEATEVTPALCATLTLTPYAVDSTSGSMSAQAGMPVTFTTQGDNASTDGGNNTGNSTDQILGCIAGAPYTSGAVSYNWAYLVTATNFAPCDSSDTLPAGDSISPASVTETVYVSCTAGEDVPLAIDIPVSIATPDSAGYVDISAGVSGTTVSVGCKTADANPDGIHFGETGVYTEASPDTNAPLGLTGIGALNADGVQTAYGPKDSAVQQWAGIVADGPSQNAAYYTGILNPPAPSPGASRVWDIVQTFAQSCPSGGSYVATQVPECDTTVDTTQDNGDISQASVSTSTLLADLVETFPDPSVSSQLDWVSARVLPGASSSAPTQLAITSGIAAGNDPSNSSAPVSSYLSNPYPATTPVWNSETLNQVLDVNNPALGAQGPYVVEGLYPDPDLTDPAGQMILLVGDASGGQEYATLTVASGVWAASPLEPLTSYADLSELGSVQAGCQAAPTAQATVSVDFSDTILAASQEIHEIRTSIGSQPMGTGTCFSGHVDIVRGLNANEAAPAGLSSIRAGRVDFDTSAASMNYTYNQMTNRLEAGFTLPRTGTFTARAFIDSAFECGGTQGPVVSISPINSAQVAVAEATISSGSDSVDAPAASQGLHAYLWAEAVYARAQNVSGFVGAYAQDGAQIGGNALGCGLAADGATSVFNDSLTGTYPELNDSFTSVEVLGFEARQDLAGGAAAPLQSDLLGVDLSTGNIDYAGGDKRPLDGEMMSQGFIFDFGNGLASASLLARTIFSAGSDGAGDNACAGLTAATPDIFSGDLESLFTYQFYRSSRACIGGGGPCVCHPGSLSMMEPAAAGDPPSLIRMTTALNDPTCASSFALDLGDTSSSYPLETVDVSAASTTFFSQPLDLQALVPDSDAVQAIGACPVDTQGAEVEAFEVAYTDSLDIPEYGAARISRDGNNVWSISSGISYSAYTSDCLSALKAIGVLANLGANAE